MVLESPMHKIKNSLENLCLQADNCINHHHLHRHDSITYSVSPVQVEFRILLCHSFLSFLISSACSNFIPIDFRSFLMFLFQMNVGAPLDLFRERLYLHSVSLTGVSIGCLSICSVNISLRFLITSLHSLSLTN